MKTQSQYKLKIKKLDHTTFQIQLIRPNGIQGLHNIYYECKNCYGECLFSSDNWSNYKTKEEWIKFTKEQLRLDGINL